MSELNNERKNASFKPRDLSIVIYDTEKNVERREWLENLLATDKKIDHPRVQYHMNHKERVNYSLLVFKRLYEIKKEKSLSEDDFSYLIQITQEKPFSLHPVFMAAFLTQASPEQLEKYESDARNFRIMGCYAQTELAHGSNVQGLMTTATYIPESDSFDLHTPCVEATKWWVGALGKTATHAIVYARLILPDGDYGVHGFFIQIRSLEDHKPLPGVVVGDIGPKLGFHAVDNGFLQLNHLKAPRNAMLSRFAHVLPGGKYQKPPHNKLGYTGMTATRVSIVSTSGITLAKAATIATRYSIIRRQFGEKGKQERQVIEYVTQQKRLFTALSDAFAIHFVGKYLTHLLEETQNNLTTGKTNLLGELHSTSSGLKALCTWMAVKGIEDCRRCCGGHGYSAFSGLTDLYTFCAHVVTAEGENYVMTQQTAKFLLKTFETSLKSGKSSPLVEYQYLGDFKKLQERCTAQNVNDFLDPNVQLQAYKHRSLRIISELAQSIASSTAKGKNSEEAFLERLQEAFKASNSHCYYLLLSNFINEVNKCKSNTPVYKSLKLLCDFFCLSHMEEEAMDFFEDGYLNKQQVNMIRELLPVLMKQIRSNAIAYADSWNFSDFVLCSAIGGKDGNVYQTLFEWAQADPINENSVLDVYPTALKPLFTGKL